jgi:transposase
MDERLKFIARLLDGEKMAPVCRQFGISRVTGYKIFNRYKECGLDALNDRSRHPTVTPTNYHFRSNGRF